LTTTWCAAHVLLDINLTFIFQKKPTLHIGPHLIEGKLANLPKPLAVLRRSHVHAPLSNQPSEDDMDVDSQSDSHKPAEDLDASTLDASGKDISWDAIAIVKRKIVFSKRPMPVVGKVA